MTLISATFLSSVKFTKPCCIGIVSSKFYPSFYYNLFCYTINTQLYILTFPKIYLIALDLCFSYYTRFEESSDDNIWCYKIYLTSNIHFTEKNIVWQNGSTLLPEETIFNNITILSVSYTHLDVYKRQVKAVC